MGMNVGPSNGDDDVMLEVNMTPLIDVMLVLIIMFIITIPTPNNAININLPNGVPPPTDTKPPEVVNIKINPQGQVLWNDELIADRNLLEARFRAVANKVDQDQVKLEPDKLAEYKNVAMVMAMAQRLGVTKIGIVNNG